MTEKPQIGFIGLGVMGFPIAGHLAKAGFDICVYNRNPEKSKDWLTSHSGSSAVTPKNAALDADVIITCVGDDSDLTDVLIGENGAIHSLKSGSLVIDHTTVSAEISQHLANTFHQKNIGYVDAPVSGGQKGAELGQLSIMCGGPSDNFNSALPIMETYGKIITHIGEQVGSGQLAKMVNQICIAGLVQGLAEGLHFAEKMQLDIEKVFKTLSQGAAQSWQMVNRYKTMYNRDFDHGFAVKWMRKDLSICLNEAKKQSISLPVTALVDQFYADIESFGGKQWDTSSLIERLRAFQN